MNKQELIKIFNSQKPRTPMESEMTMMMLKLMLLKNDDFDKDINEIDKKGKAYNHFRPVIESVFIKIFLTRLKFVNLKINLGALLILSEYFTTPAKAVMYVFYLFYNLPENTLITINTIGELFDNGFFSEEQLNHIWNKQKVGKKDRIDHTCIGAPDNMIDYLEVWKR